jgi:hypothetical protein
MLFHQSGHVIICTTGEAILRPGRAANDSAKVNADTAVDADAAANIDSAGRQKSCIAKSNTPGLQRLLCLNLIRPLK